MDQSNRPASANLPLERLVSTALGQLEQLGYSRRSLNRYRAIWKHLIEFSRQKKLGNEFSEILGACRTWHRNESHQGHPVENHALFPGHEEDLRVFSNGKSSPINLSSPQCMHSFQIPSNTDQTPFTLNGI